jgi:hypothetical protein
MDASDLRRSDYCDVGPDSVDESFGVSLPSQIDL